MARGKADIFSEVVVGIFMLAVLALLVYFTIVISGVDVLGGREKVRVDISFASVGGLKAHDNVMYRGTKVGAVEDIVVTPSNLVVQIELDRSVVLRQGYRASVCSLSMLGGNFLQLEEGVGEVIELGSTSLLGETPSDWMQDIAKVAKNLNEITSREEIRSVITNIAAVSQSVRRLSERVERGEGVIGKLFDEKSTLYEDLSLAISNAVIVSENIAEVSQRIKNTTMIDDLEGGAKAFREAGQSLDLKTIVKRAEEVVANLNEVALKLKSGEGTMGRLLTDESLYNDVQGLIKDARQVLDNYRDTTPVTTFGSLVTGAL
ncbi:MAG: MCE family protein [Kiritimatiellae bacterium]|nr:MCE family protein [Kiritimatiellia bacterium]